MYKKQIRLNFREKRNLLSFDSIENQSLEIANRVLDLPIWDASFYHIFLSITKNREVSTEPILSIIQGKDKNVVVPKTFPNGFLKNFLLTDSVVIKENSLGIPEPVGGIEIPEDQLDVVFVPMLAFDNKGHRVGYGGGYYDVLLKKCRPKTLKVGLSFFEAVDQIEDINENDIPMDYCVTPEKIYEF
ncbi:MAG: 5-formyltetrahydrofolate cyclo-ligase [Bacteroidota bacterium]